MTRVKICGLTTKQDVCVAVRLGAWACGFVLSRSPRRVTLASAAELVPHTGRALAVAVVTTEDPEWIADAVAAGGFDAVQLSAGAEGPAVAAVQAAAQSRGLRPLIIAADDTVGVRAADLYLLDARTPDTYGGTGRTLDWGALAAEHPPRERLVLAGGLHPANVDRAIALVRPHAVDVSGGVERAPGIKDPALLRSFFDAVARVDHFGGAPV
ncbi:MAG: phosphoribosylanthranilate isomerase [Thermoleophilia bacterium]|nr:phosphoribosylanthranilate isomerase [Thermoleophilia bacterium]